MLLRQSCEWLRSTLTWHKSTRPSRFFRYSNLLITRSSSSRCIWTGHEEKTMETRRQTRPKRANADARPSAKDTERSETTSQNPKKRKAPSVKEESDGSKSNKQSVDAKSNSDGVYAPQTASRQRSSPKKYPKYLSIEYEDSNTTEYDPQWSREYPHPLWRKQYNNIVKMREKETAPVDDMGCERSAEEEKSPKEKRYHTLVSLMLSSQTKVCILCTTFFYCFFFSEVEIYYELQDEITHKAVRRLQEYGLTPSNIAKTAESTIADTIYPVGFYRRKAKYIKQATEVLLKDYDGDIPDTIKGLTALPGVGPKMAYICMNVAWGEPVGIGVDVHVHRIANRLHWVNTKTPEETREAMEDFLPLDYWISVNPLLVGFGQEICLPRNPLCDQCLNKDICPTGRSSSKKGK